MAILGFTARAGHSKKEGEKKRPAPRRRGGFRLALGIATIVILSFLLSMHLLPDTVSLQVGDVSSEEIRAHRTVRYVDSIGTERLRAEAASRADKVYEIVPKAAFQASESVSNIFDIFRRARLDDSLPSIAAKTDFVRRNLRLNLDADALAALLTADPSTFSKIETYTKQLIAETMDREIRDDTNDVEEALAEFRRRLTNYLGDSKYVNVDVQIGRSIIRPNRIFDPVRTKEAKDQERRSVPVQYRHIYLGEVVIEKDERVTPEHIDKFMALGLRQPQVDYVTVLCVALLVTSVVTLTII